MVPRQHQVEEGRERDRLARLYAEDMQHPVFVRLVDEGREERGGEAEKAGRG